MENACMGGICCICGFIIGFIIGGIIGTCWCPTRTGPIGVIAVTGMDCIGAAIGGATICGIICGIIGCWETGINGVLPNPPGIIACGEAIGIIPGGIIPWGIVPGDIVPWGTIPWGIICGGLIPAGGSKIVRGALPVRQRIKPQLW
jgi:hypothetical protein